ncbi:hypothetical protein ACOME3_010497 [Neoechinorhynchus agilis]
MESMRTPNLPMDLIAAQVQRRFDPRWGPFGHRISSSIGVSVFHFKCPTPAQLLRLVNPRWSRCEHRISRSVGFISRYYLKGLIPAEVKRRLIRDGVHSGTGFPALSVFRFSTSNVQPRLNYCAWLIRDGVDANTESPDRSDSIPAEVQRRFDPRWGPFGHRIPSSNGVSVFHFKCPTPAQLQRRVNPRWSQCAHRISRWVGFIFRRYLKDSIPAEVQRRFDPRWGPFGHRISSSIGVSVFHFKCPTPAQLLCLVNPRWSRCEHRISRWVGFIFRRYLKDSIPAEVQRRFDPRWGPFGHRISSSIGVSVFHFKCPTPAQLLCLVNPRWSRCEHRISRWVGFIFRRYLKDSIPAEVQRRFDPRWGPFGHRIYSSIGVSVFHFKCPTPAQLLRLVNPRWSRCEHRISRSVGFISRYYLKGLIPAEVKRRLIRDGVHSGTGFPALSVFRFSTSNVQPRLNYYAWLIRDGVDANTESPDRSDSIPAEVQRRFDPRWGPFRHRIPSSNGVSVFHFKCPSPAQLLRLVNPRWSRCEHRISRSVGFISRYYLKGLIPAEVKRRLIRDGVHSGTGFPALSVFRFSTSNVQPRLNYYAWLIRDGVDANTESPDRSFNAGLIRDGVHSGIGSPALMVFRFSISNVHPRLNYYAWLIRDGVHANTESPDPSVLFFVVI